MSRFGRRFPIKAHLPKLSLLLFAPAPTGTTFYLNSSTTISARNHGVYPAAALAAWDETDAAQFGALHISYLTTTPNSGSPIQQTQGTSSAWASQGAGVNQLLGIYPLASDRLDAQTVGSGNWEFAFALKMNNASANLTWEPRAALYLVNGSTGAIRTVIFELALPTGAAIGRTGTGEVTIFSTTCSGSSFTAVGGDYLILEVGMLASSVSGTNTPVTFYYDQGVTPILNDNSITNDADAVLIAPAVLTFVILPTWGWEPTFPYLPQEVTKIASV